jgi:phosphate starvation-inducible protein PhoH
MIKGGSRKGRGKDQVREDKVNQGNQQIKDEIAANREQYDTSWFKPTEAQKEIIYSMCTNPLTLCQGVSGCGKSTTAIAQALKELKSGRYRQIIFIKTASETSDDQIGFLPNSAADKISVHMEAMRSIFWQFMSKAKLELEEKRGTIQFTIPNFIAGKSLENSLVIIDECQMISPNIVKLLLERCGEGSTYVVLGDKAQTYSAKKRPDGFTDFVRKVTEVGSDGVRYSKEPLIGYVELTAKDNMRSELSRRVVEIYEEG